MKTPYIRITSDELIILPNVMSGPKRIELDHIQDIDFSVEGKILLLLKNDKEVEIKLSHVHKNEDLHLIKALKKIKMTDEAFKIN